MNKKFIAILVSILAICGMVMIAGSALATVTSVSITSPATTTFYKPQSGSEAAGYLSITVTADTATTADLYYRIGPESSPVYETPYGAQASLATGTILITGLPFPIPATTTDGLYDVFVKLHQPYGGGGGVWVSATGTNLIGVDGTAPTSAATIAQSGYNATTWVDASTINGTVSDGAGSGVKTLTITIKDNDNSKYWDGDSWEDSSTDLSVTSSGNTWTYSLDDNKFISEHNYTVTPTATDNLDNSAPGISDSFIYDTTAPTMSAISFAGKTGTGSGTTWTVDINDVTNEALLDTGTTTVSEASTLQSKTVDGTDVSTWCSPVSLVAGANTGSIKSLLGFSQDITFDVLKAQDTDNDGDLEVVVELKDAFNNTTSITINIKLDETAPTMSAISFAGKTGTGSGTTWTVDINDVTNEALLDTGTTTVSEASTLQSKTVDGTDVSTWCSPVSLVAGANTGSIKSLLGFSQDITFDVLKAQDTDNDGDLEVVVELKDAFNNTTSITINIKLDETAPTMTSLTATINGTNITSTTGELTCEVGCTVSSIKVLLNEPVTVVDTPVVTIDSLGNYGTISLDPSDLTNKTLIIAPNPGNETSGLVGDFTFRVIAGAVKDAWGNQNAETTFILHVEDTAAPSVVISSTLSNPTKTSPIPITVTFSEAVTGFELADVTVGNATTSNFAITSDAIYTLDVTPISDGVVTVDIAADKAIDAVGNGNTAADHFSIIYYADTYTFTVGPTGDYDYHTIQDAVDAASNGDTINVAAGIYDEQIIINKELTLNGAGGSETKIIPASTTLAAIPSSEGIAGIIIVEGTTVNLSNLSVGGTNISELPEDAGAVAGIILNNATGTIRGVAVSDFPEPEEIDSIGIILSATTTNAFVTIDTCMILDYGTIGIALFGDKLTADIRNCNIGMGVVGVLADESIDAAKIKVNFNHISGNTDFGVGNENTSITLDATNNWWGDKSGPAHASNPDGIGNAVSDKVYYEPWLGAEVENIVTETKTDSTIDAKEEADTEIIVTGGTATVTVAKYSANPGTGFSGDIGKYIDVHLDSGSGATELEIRLHYTDADISGKDESTLKMYWWNGTNWSPCSDTGVNTSLNYIWAKISSTSTTPDLYFDKLAGTPFAGAGNAAPSYSSSMSGQFSPSVSYQNKPEEPEITIEELEARVAELRAMISELQLRLRSQQALAYQGIPANFTFKNDLKYGMTSDEVKHLQIILKTEIGSPTYPEDVPATGWFGPITKAAVIKFQEKYASEILAPWNLTTGTGLVGSTTRAKLNSLLK